MKFHHGYVTFENVIELDLFLAAYKSTMTIEALHRVDSHFRQNYIEGKIGNSYYVSKANYNYFLYAREQLTLPNVIEWTL